MSSPANFDAFTPKTRALTIVVAISGLISSLSIVALLTWAAVLVLRPYLQGMRERNTNKAVLFFRTRLGIYVCCLLASNLMNAVGAMLSFNWVRQGGISTGLICSVQGSLLQIGDVAASIFTSAIAIHTFRSLILRRSSSRIVTVLVVGLGFGASISLATALTGVANAVDGPFFDSQELWCAISGVFKVELFLVYIVPLIVAMMIASILYALIFLCLRGTLVIRGGLRLNLSPDNVQGAFGRLSNDAEYRHFLASIGKNLLWFPVAYIVCYFPLLVIGLIFVVDPLEANSLTGLVALAGSAASLTGFANALVLANILRVLRPAIKAAIYKTHIANESFLAPEKHRRKPPPAIEENVLSFGSATISDLAILPSRPEKALSPQSLLARSNSTRSELSRPLSVLSKPSSQCGLPSSPRDPRGIPGRPTSPQARARKKSEHEVTPELREMWLRRSRSGGSVDSSSILLSSPNIRPTRGRVGSNPTSVESISGVLNSGPIMSHADLSRHLESPIVRSPSRSRNGTPPPTSTPYRGSTIYVALPVAPRSLSKAETRRSLGSEMRSSYRGVPIPPVPPLPLSPPLRKKSLESVSVYTQSEAPHEPMPQHLRQGFNTFNRKSPLVGPPVNTVVAPQRYGTPDVGSSLESASSDSHTALIKTRPAVSAVADARYIELGMRFKDNESSGMSHRTASIRSRESVDSKSVDTMHSVIRNRVEEMDNARMALSKLAWEKLIAPQTSPATETIEDEEAIRSPVSPTTTSARYDVHTALPRSPLRERITKPVPLSHDASSRNMYYDVAAVSSEGATTPQSESAQAQLKLVRFQNTTEMSPSRFSQGASPPSQSRSLSPRRDGYI